MEKFLINGGRKLSGHVKVDAAKNSFVAILAASVLCEGEIWLDEFVDLTDITCMLEILKNLGVKAEIFDKKLHLDVKNAKNSVISHEFTNKVRSSIFLLGSLLGRFRKAVIAYPGGCKIGARPIDIHLAGFRALGVEIEEKHGYIYCDGEHMHSGFFEMPFPSVGATESLMMCASVLAGTTIIKNVAREPEIVDLQNFLNAMGARVRGAGTECIKIEGVKKLNSATFSVMPDRIVAGTYLLAAAICGGDVLIENAVAKHNESLLHFLKQTACKIEVRDDKIRLKADGRLSSIKRIDTAPYPDFPTDLQPQMMVLQSVSDGECELYENVFESRFALVPELCKMGANIKIECGCAKIAGVKKLYGADVYASDLRAGAGLVLAGLCAEGYTSVYNLNYIDRGYEKIEEKLSLLNADIKRIIV